MKFLIVFVALFAVALAGPVSNEAYILKSDADVHATGFNYAFETSDGNKQQAEGILNNVGTDAESLAVRGSFSYVADDGQTYTINYVADENGYQPQGAHLPVAPEA
ncbi:hypothetical protein ACLKA7_016865 [Drosophila subpalustris]